MTLRLNLGRYLKEHNISAYRLAQEVQGRVAPNTVYSLARKPARRIDLGTVGELLEALGRVQGEAVNITEIVVESAEEPKGNLEHLRADSTPVYSPDPNKKFRYSGVRAKLKGEGPSSETIIAQLRGHE